MIKIGDLIEGRYRILSRVATGGMADLYEANDVIAGRVVCLKVMKAELLSNPENAARFENEMTAGAALHHLNIISVYGGGKIEGRPYMANEFIKAKTLREFLNSRGTFPLAEACEIMLQVCDGIGYMHKHGIVHRDIKPDNLFYSIDGTVKIGDLGIARHIGERCDAGQIQGTIYYCAPEVLLGKPAEIGNDIYAMGVLFYELLVGKPPFEGRDPEEIANKHLKAHFPEPSRAMVSVPPAFDFIITKACKKRASERYQSAEEFSSAIRKAMSDKSNFEEKKGILSRIFGFK